jgi:hypothetical protein
MDQRQYFDGQLVDQTDLNAPVANTYNAVRDRTKDIGVFGIVTGGNITPVSPTPDLTVDMDSLLAYDQAGDRIERGTAYNVDCSVDHNGNPTVPTTPGYSVWISLHGRWKTVDTDSKVIKGETKYLTKAASWEVRVVAGTAATTGTHTKPAPPSDAVLIVDIELDYGQTQIQAGDIDATRKDTWEFVDADKIGVSAGSWTKIDSAAAHVQAALDSVDTELISRDATGDLDQHLLPDGNTRDLGSASRVWGEAHLTDITAYNAILASADGKNLGSGAARFVGYFNTATIYTKLAAAAGGENIGDATKQFDANLYNVTAYNAILASATGKALGGASARFVAHLDAFTNYGALIGSVQFDAAETVADILLPIHDFVSVAGTDWDWNSTRTYVQCSASGKVCHVYFKPLHGEEISSMGIRWAQSGGSGTQAQIEKIDEDNAPTSIGSAKTITTTDGTTNWDTIASGLTDTVDLKTYAYRVKVTSAAGVSWFFRLRITYKVTDILKAALMRG